MYADGEGVPEDFVYAYKWINLAAAQGYEDAREDREIMSKKMTKEQISEAQKLSSEWFKKNAEKLR
jgi:TPR repeat protein